MDADTFSNIQIGYNFNSLDRRKTQKASFLLTMSLESIVKANDQERFYPSSALSDLA